MVRRGVQIFFSVVWKSLLFQSVLEIAAVVLNRDLSLELVVGLVALCIAEATKE